MKEMWFKYSIKESIFWYNARHPEWESFFHRNYLRITNKIQLLTAFSTLPESIQSLIMKVNNTIVFKPQHIRRFVLESYIKEKDLEPWIDYDHPVTDSYGRKLVFKNDHFEIMVMSWCPGDYSAIHDHGYTQWGAVQVFGQAEHATFIVKGDKLVTTSRQLLEEGDVIGVNHALVHQMGNPADTYFCTLHVYGIQEKVENVTGDARIFDLRRKLIHRVDGGVFFALNMERINRSEPGFRGDYPTCLRFLVELYNRMLKMEQFGVGDSKYELSALHSELFNVSQIGLLENYLSTLKKESEVKYQRKLNQLKWELNAAANLQEKVFREFHEFNPTRSYPDGRAIDGEQVNYLELLSFLDIAPD
jgi:predicted metal-dependent enzyme (double-stranded beta helix superfamily)